MLECTAQQAPPIAASERDFLIATAARAPSVHNTQPWRFRVTERSIDLYADPSRKLHIDPIGREMLISCGAALFGLRLAVRSLGYLPVVRLLPDPAQLRLLASVTLGSPQPATALERRLLEALPHRHTHRGPFAPDAVPAGLIAALQHDALAEGARLVPADLVNDHRQLADILTALRRRQDRDPLAQADIRRWTRAPASGARDGVPAAAFAASASGHPDQLRQRDFDLGRGLGQLTAGETPPAAVMALLTLRDSRADWLRAGQALHRLLLRAATAWVFARIDTQPLEAAAVRVLVRERLALPGAPQALLQFGAAHTAPATARRPPAELIVPQDENVVSSGRHEPRPRA